jgi:uncharacterized membrane protein (GlpM family)
VSEWLTVVIKAIAGGSLVVAFAVLSQALRPKRFAGLFGAAPAIAIAGLTVTLASKGARDAAQASLGMVAGSIGMVFYAATTVRTITRRRPLVGPALSLVAWALPASMVGVFLL